jgi:hypothetical protein
MRGGRLTTRGGYHASRAKCLPRGT